MYISVVGLQFPTLVHQEVASTESRSMQYKSNSSNPRNEIVIEYETSAFTTAAYQIYANTTRYLMRKNATGMARREIYFVIETADRFKSIF